MTYPTTTALLEALDPSEHPSSVTLRRWKLAGIVRPVEQHRSYQRGHAWPSWTPRMVRLANLELGGGPTGGVKRRCIYDVLRDTATVLEQYPDAIYATIDPDGGLGAHTAARTVAELALEAGSLTIVAIPT